MIVGRFDDTGRPQVECRVIIRRLGVDERMAFLLDTGADNTYLHLEDAEALGVPFEQLVRRTDARGVGGRSSYFRELAFLVFDDNAQRRIYTVELRIAGPDESNLTLPSLLGRNVINHWYVQYDPTNFRLDCIVRHADHTLDAT